MAAPKQTDPQFKLRMPQAIKDALDEAVTASGRTLNAEIVWRLEQSFDRDRRWAEQQRLVAEAKPKMDAEWEAHQTSTHPLDVAARNARKDLELAIRAKIYTDMADLGVLTDDHVSKLANDNPEILQLVQGYLAARRK